MQNPFFRRFKCWIRCNLKSNSRTQTKRIRSAQPKRYNFTRKKPKLQYPITSKPYLPQLPNLTGPCLRSTPLVDRAAPQASARILPGGARRRHAKPRAEAEVAITHHQHLSVVGGLGAWLSGCTWDSGLVDMPTDALARRTTKEGSRRKYCGTRPHRQGHLFFSIVKWPSGGEVWFFLLLAGAAGRLPRASTHGQSFESCCYVPR